MSAHHKAKTFNVINSCTFSKHGAKPVYTNQELCSCFRPYTLIEIIFLIFFNHIWFHMSTVHIKTDCHLHSARGVGNKTYQNINLLQAIFFPSSVLLIWFGRMEYWTNYKFASLWSDQKNWSQDQCWTSNRKMTESK